MNEEMNSKIYKSIDEMVEYLYKSKKIIVDNEDKHYFEYLNLDRDKSTFKSHRDFCF